MTQHVSHRDSDVIHELRVEVEQLKARVAALTILPHELDALRKATLYLRSVAQALPDGPGDSFAARMRMFSHVIDEMIERMERK